MTTPANTEADILENDSDSLPFSIDKKSFSIWLVNLDTSDKLKALDVLLSILSALKKIIMEPDVRFFFLEKIATLAFQFSEELQQTYIKSYFPFSESDTSKVKLSEHCAIEIAENYSLLAKDKCFKTKEVFLPQQKALILFNGIQAMTSVYFYKSMLYEKPGKGFWALCYLLYLFAKQNEVAELSPDNRNSCFIKVFKQLLVFELSNVQQFNTEEMHAIFHLLNNFSEHIGLFSNVPEDKVTSVPCFNLRIDLPPAIPKAVVAEELPHQFYISNLRLIKKLMGFIELKKTISYSNKIMILRLIKTLTLNLHRRNERELIDSEVFAEIGFNEFNQFYLHRQKRLEGKGFTFQEKSGSNIDENINKTSHADDDKQESSLSLAWRPEDGGIEHIGNNSIWEAGENKPEPKPKSKLPEVLSSLAIENLSTEEQMQKNSRSESRGQRNELDAGLSLTWRPEDNVVEYIGGADIWAAEEDTPDANAKLIDQSKLGFCIGLKDKNAATKVGDIIHLIISSSSILTVVRRIVSAHSDGLVIGVEVLGYDAELFNVIDTKNEDSKTVCISVNIDGVESLVIKANDFLGQEYLFVEREEKIIRYRVEKVLNSSTSIFKHLKVSFFNDTDKIT